MVTCKNQRIQCRSVAGISTSRGSSSPRPNSATASIATITTITAITAITAITTITTFYDISLSVPVLVVVFIALVYKIRHARLVRSHQRQEKERVKQLSKQGSGSGSLARKELTDEHRKVLIKHFEKTIDMSPEKSPEEAKVRLHTNSLHPSSHDPHPPPPPQPALNPFLDRSSLQPAERSPKRLVQRGVQARERH